MGETTGRSIRKRAQSDGDEYQPFTKRRATSKRGPSQLRDRNQSADTALKIHPSDDTRVTRSTRAKPITFTPNDDDGMYKRLRRECLGDGRDGVAGVTVMLDNAELWAQFHAFGNEMIVTKSGRCMFPTLCFQFGNLDPTALYSIALDIVQSVPQRFRFSYKDGMWAPVLEAKSDDEPNAQNELPRPCRAHILPVGIQTGEYWTSHPANFSKIKLTNSATPPSSTSTSLVPDGYFLLRSFHQYQPRVHLIKHSQSFTIGSKRGADLAGGDVVTTYVFEETRFMAVTHYQSQKVNTLKKNYNPHAKGFKVCVVVAFGRSLTGYGVADISFHQDEDIKHTVSRLRSRPIEQSPAIQQPQPIISFTAYPTYRGGSSQDASESMRVPDVKRPRYKEEDTDSESSAYDNADVEVKKENVVQDDRRASNASVDTLRLQQDSESQCSAAGTSDACEDCYEASDDDSMAAIRGLVSDASPVSKPPYRKPSLAASYDEIPVHEATPAVTQKLTTASIPVSLIPPISSADDDWDIDLDDTHHPNHPRAVHPPLHVVTNTHRRRSLPTQNPLDVLATVCNYIIDSGDLTRAPSEIATSELSQPSSIPSKRRASDAHWDANKENRVKVDDAVARMARCTASRLGALVSACEMRSARM
ncbi:uncharacterized protein EV422DRAFT_45696 [Fimicolochytrium jonesii]|uniref:uncharacterized protein n=1 Tax=Fimicolochytrium jonesii TaxID=1396493 RepID=UPI0022FEBE06|nr:uncharacterized protein EV422DRAFT_45696 [Fimicolochytrium jonesii]KAI8821519.1 hypothetical protein EV422DRAFT_45696 [Fimicolochytrium jonesii]